MAHKLQVNSVTVGELLDKLRTREWMIPAFQRDFVWSISDVTDFVYSVLKCRPIGMATLWRQSDESELPLEPVSIRNRQNRIVLPGAETPPATRYAVLDGRQRCTAIAMAFGGLRPKDGRVRFRGRFFLNVAEEDDAERIKFVREANVVKRGLDSDAGAIGAGLFPLSNTNPGESLMQQWYRYSQAIQTSANYPDSKLPDEDELKRRNQILAQSFQGLLETKLAVYTVPSSFSLSQICDIFEVLNTTGTKVSTVDLIHSWLYSETSRVEQQTPILLRDWIDRLGEVSGAVGWSSSRERPELIAQMATATYVSLEVKPDPRKIGRRKQSRITSVKSGDLLATPTLHWQNIISYEDKLVKFLSDFQQCVSFGAFGWQACPYPVTASIYVGLRWHHEFDPDSTHPWEIADLDALFRAFFWRNALSSRYDQGFLTQLGTDIVQLKSILGLRLKYRSFDEWAAEATDRLETFMNITIPKSTQLSKLYSDRQTGALQKALLLPIVTRARWDLLNRNVAISYPTRRDIQLHHIYPQAWCRDNRTPKLRQWLDPEKSKVDWVKSAANLMPLTRESNLEWRAANPGAVLLNKNITYASHGELFSDLFISEEAYHDLCKGHARIPHFWKARARTMADELEKFLFVGSKSPGAQ